MPPPIRQPATRPAWTDEPAKPDRTEFTARTHSTIHSIATAAHLGTLGTYIESLDDGRWLVPIAAKADADGTSLRTALVNACQMAGQS